MRSVKRLENQTNEPLVDVPTIEMSKTILFQIISTGTSLKILKIYINWAKRLWYVRITSKKIELNVLISY